MGLDKFLDWAALGFFLTGTYLIHKIKQQQKEYEESGGIILKDKVIIPQPDPLYKGKLLLGEIRQERRDRYGIVFG